MGDSSLVTWLSLAPLIVVVFSLAAAVIAWRTGKRNVRVAVAVVLMVLGIASLASTAGMLFSMAAGALIIAIGLVLLLAGQGSRSDA